jgi:hypothetical protein
MRICLVMGAGASLANAEHFRPERKTATHPPLDFTFFQKIEELGVKVPVDLRKYASHLPTGTPFLDAGGNGGRMEEFLRDLFHDFLQQRASSTSEPVRAYRELVRLYAAVLRTTTNWMHKDSYTGGPVGRLLNAAADSADRVDIITFNHDLVIENEIFKRARLRGRWCIETSYGKFAAGKTFLQSTGVSMFPMHSDSDCDHSRPLVVHKMHGSLNWWIRTRSRDPTPGVLAGDVSSPDVMITRERNLRDVHHVRMKPGGQGSTWNVWPVIVPPVYNKGALIEAFMPSVWAEAREALSTSDRVVFFGYSLPMGDIEAEKAVQRAISTNQQAPWIGIIDPNPSLTARYGYLLPKAPLRWYPNAVSFFNSVFG